MLARLLENPFQDPKKMEEFAFHHADSHKQILQALQNLFQIKLTDYPLYPYNVHNQQQFLIWHQSMHNAFTGYLQFTGAELNRVDFNDPQQQKQWISENYTEHYSAHLALGI
jgi:hypothetical protein